MEKIRILIVDDLPQVRQGLATVLQLAARRTSPTIEVIGEAQNGSEAIQQARLLQPDVILMDLEMPIIDGYEATRRIKAELPATRIIILSVHADPEAMQRARAAGRTSGFSVTVFDEKKIASLNMGGLLGVASGSVKPPRFIVMEYSPRKKRATLPTIVLVGKGVTFDSGGISIKPSANMAEMKMDMSGAAAVIGAMQAASTLRLPVRLVGLVPATENLPGGNALKPGDILRHLNGKTSEIDNTDAEGRLILADALAYASRYRPDLVIDVATLTGAVVVALAHLATGMMGTSEPQMQQMRAAGDRTFERVWQLPLFEEYEKLIKSDVADVKNVGGRWGGAITAAMFLKHFIGEYPWIHLDIAGTAILEESGDYAPRGGSGVGVRLLVDFLRHWQKG